MFLIGSNHRLMKYNGDTLFENLKEVTAIMKKLLTLMLLVSLCLSGCALGNNVSDILKIC